MELNFKTDVETPSVPNYIRRTDGQMMPLSAFTDDALREIGAAWTEGLIANAQRQRKGFWGK